jgi:hypothetical protein
MTYTTDFTNLLTSNDTDVVSTTTNAIKALGTDDQLALLWYVYTEMGKSITPAAPGAARMQFAEGLINQVKQMSHGEQLQFMRDLVEKRSTPATRAYGLFSVNTKLGFWYELSELMVKGFVVPMPQGHQISRDAAYVLDALKKLDFGQQITVLRNAVVNMGVDPLNA